MARVRQICKALLLIELSSDPEPLLPDATPFHSIAQASLGGSEPLCRGLQRPLPRLPLGMFVVRGECLVLPVTQPRGDDLEVEEPWRLMPHTLLAQENLAIDQVDGAEGKVRVCSDEGIGVARLNGVRGIRVDLSQQLRESLSHPLRVP
jgi:hypothetical protein